MDLATPVIVGTYAEIALKGRNRAMFLRRLMNNIRAALKGLPVSGIRHVESRIVVELEDTAVADEAAARLRRVYGLVWISPAVRIGRDQVDGELAEDLATKAAPRLSAVCAAAIALAERDRGAAANFKIDTRRSDRTFPITSLDISREVGRAVHEACRLPGRMAQPDFVVNVLVLREAVLVFTGKIQAYGGLPAGSSGRVMVLLSGGLDSPVAAWLMMRRGVKAEFIHFYAGRTVEEADAGKIEALVALLARWSPSPLTLWLVPVVPYEMRAIGTVPDNHDMVLFRRFMVKCAERMARRTSCGALVTGDSLGQVASQTLENLAAIGPDVRLPVLRPLVGMDKVEITAWSREIGAFDTSILPYRDCCSIRSPRPVLHAKADDLLTWSEAMKMDEAVNEALAAAAKRVIRA
ncbi:MAG TPA: tRNA uracil 4-sulfurtransferase ThiI [Candidatus Krumholzibacteria bacterium]|nr:tRNA uracil 4-sulfurtransferase ThiI [Candidatus Krumholzibacteria bacterium]